MRNYQLYVRFDATVNGNGGGGTGQTAAPTTPSSTPAPARRSRSRSTPTRRPTRPTATTPLPVYAALRADRPFLAASSGFAGTASDGLVQLDADRRLTHHLHDTRTDGNVVQTAQRRRPRGRPRAPWRSVSATTRPRRSPRAGAPPRHDTFKTLHSATATAGRTTTAASTARQAVAGLTRRAAQRELERTVLPVGERAEGQRGQDLPRRDRRLPGQPVGSGGARPATRPTPTSAPTARSSPATSTRRSPACSPPATPPPRRTPSASCSSVSSSRTVRCRATA